jgi:hypothetical protein
VLTMVEIGTYEGWRDRLLEFYPLSVSNREKKLLARRSAASRKPEDRCGDSYSLSTTVRRTAFFRSHRGHCGGSATLPKYYLGSAVPPQSGHG